MLGKRNSVNNGVIRKWYFQHKSQPVLGKRNSINNGVLLEILRAIGRWNVRTRNDLSEEVERKALFLV